MVPQPESVKLYPHFIHGTRHTSRTLRDASGVKLATIYHALRRMVRDGWITQIKIPGDSTRQYVVTDLGRRSMRFAIELHDGSLSSNPTAWRSSS